MNFYYLFLGLKFNIPFDLRVAQLGRAPAWGAGGRWFKSSRADQINL